MTRIIAACGNDCSVCPRYVNHPYEKTDARLQHTAELWHTIGYRDHVVSKEEISCHGCRLENRCRYRIVSCCCEKGVKTCAACSFYPCAKLEECLAVTVSFAPACRKACSEEEYEQLRRAFFEKKENLDSLKEQKEDK
ncbi:MAG: DUF3795 domain-containing protein [Solobacterium sp.]|nr:DUF3795 domain-containing protein [Solobacterium sp.]